jgi:uncharacterized integral membrane protein (TIGR00698 family)
VSFAVAVLSFLLSRVVPVASPALTAIVLGVIAANTRLLPDGLQPGLAVAAKPVLRIGIVLLGLQLALGDVLALGLGTLALIVFIVTAGVGTGVLLGRWLGIPRIQTLLIACGFSICGAAAVAAASGSLSPERRAGESEADALSRHETRTATAVALVVVFGTLMIPLMPVLTGALGLDQRESGTWIGASVHEVAQVVAAGSLTAGDGSETLGVAVLVKLGRVLMLAPMIAVLVGLDRRQVDTEGQDEGSEDGQGDRRERVRPPLVPGFVVFFLVAVALRSTGFVPSIVLDVAAPIQTMLLAAAMFALGTGVKVSLLRQVGGRPVALAALITLVVVLLGGIGAALVA